MEEFIRLLTEAGVRQLVDVRERAWSHRPEYRKTALSTALGEAGIEYQHLRSAGNPFRPTKGRSLAFEECARLYREHLKADAQPVEDLAATVTQRPTAVFCYEADHECCHRSVLIGEVLELIHRGRVVEL